MIFIKLVYITTIRQLLICKMIDTYFINKLNGDVNINF